MVYEAARLCKGINLRGREAYDTVPNIGVAPAYVRNLLSILHDADRLATLKIQLAVTINAGRIFVSKRT